ncbi:hypothetical protein IQ06DRAFT_54486 [Phaeosphaeriaceae sp. SRC1lsM3a]|nr:hypothetical protein IQ06DRAFT_54486 [Stagonospora sp. SRC1lsM3a]
MITARIWLEEVAVDHDERCCMCTNKTDAFTSSRLSDSNSSMKLQSTTSTHSEVLRNLKTIIATSTRSWNILCVSLTVQLPKIHNSMTHIPVLPPGLSRDPRWQDQPHTQSCSIMIKNQSFRITRSQYHIGTAFAGTISSFPSTSQPRSHAT